MKTRHLPVTAACAATALIIAACGGSGSGSGLTAAAPPAPLALAGTAATGAAFDNAAITVTDRSGAVVGSGRSAADGSYTITLAAGAVGPFVVQAVREAETLVSVAPETGGTVNITPITHLIAARLAVSGDPTRLAAEFQANPGQITDASITDRVEEVVTALRPLLDAAGVSVNPLTASFAANGEGVDRVLDSLSITITPASATASNIEVAVKQTMAEGEVAPSVRITSSAGLPALPAVDAAKLVKPGTAQLIAALLERMNACYALPVAERVTVANTDGQTAAGIRAAACKEIFHNDDPATFLSNGARVGSNSGDAFASIFRSRGNNLVFDRGTYEFSRANGDIVIGYRSTDAEGNVTQATFAVRPDNAAAPTKLRQIGNQYTYSGGVTPYHQLRSFVNQPASDYLSTGYSFSVANAVDGGGNPIFDRVVVTTPRNTTLTLKPQAGFALLQLARGGSPTGNAFLRLRSVYLSPSKASENPATADTTLFFAATPYQDAEIEAFGQKGLWKFDYYLAGAPAVLAETQYFRTRARALSIGELKQKAMAELTPATVAALVAGSSAQGVLPVPAAGFPMAWTVGADAPAPTSVAVWGFLQGTTPRVNFNDGLTIGSATRSATVPCLKKTTGDSHCTGTAVNVASNYVSTGRLTGMHLFARDAGGREYAHFYATYGIGGE